MRCLGGLPPVDMRPVRLRGGISILDKFTW